MPRNRIMRINNTYMKCFFSGLFPIFYCCCCCFGPSRAEARFRQHHLSSIQLALQSCELNSLISFKEPLSYIVLQYTSTKHSSAFNSPLSKVDLTPNSTRTSSIIWKRVRAPSNVAVCLSRI